MRVLGLIQARVSSARLPAKVMQPLLGVPMILRQIERLNRCRQVSQWVVAISQDATDDVLEDLLRTAGVAVFRGALNDVLGRFYAAAQVYPAEHIVRITADCPLIDAAVVDEVVALHLQDKPDYTSNVMPPTFPDGLDVEIMSYSTLQRLHQLAQLPSQREHVTLYLRQHTAQFSVALLRAPNDLSDLRWTVDEAADFTFVAAVYERLYAHNPAFQMQDVVRLLAQDVALSDVNAHYSRNAGLTLSLQTEHEACG